MRRNPSVANKKKPNPFAMVPISDANKKVKRRRPKCHVENPSVVDEKKFSPMRRKSSVADPSVTMRT